MENYQKRQPLPGFLCFVLSLFPLFFPPLYLPTLPQSSLPRILDWRFRNSEFHPTPIRSPRSAIPDPHSHILTFVPSHLTSHSTFIIQHSTFLCFPIQHSKFIISLGSKFIIPKFILYRC